MIKKKEELFFTLAGIIYLLLGITALFNAFYYNRPHQVFWFCYSGMIIMGIGLLGHERTLVQSQLYILLIPDLVWTIDFASYLLQGHSSFGIVDYFFEPAPLSAKIITLQHLTTIPLALYFFYKRGVINSPLWLVGWIQLAVIYGLTRLATEAQENVNCIYSPCGNIPIHGEYYFWWFALSFLMIYVTHCLVRQLPGIRMSPV